ncbi:MAG: ABC transporter permease [Pirellulales bacterium]
MSLLRLIVAGLRYHWRVHVAVGLGVVVATAVLTGALLVGDSVRGSLRELTYQRLGRIDEVLLTERFFRQRLASELASQARFEEHFAQAVPAILLQGSVETHPEKTALAGQVTLLGVQPSFWRLGPGRPSAELEGDVVVLNEPLAADLGVQVGDQVMVRIPLGSQIPADSPLGKKAGRIRGLTLRVVDVLPADGIGRFSLRPNQRRPLNAYIPLRTLQQAVDQADRVNAILVAGGSVQTAPSPQASRALSEALQPTWDDYGLSAERIAVGDNANPVSQYISITSDRMLLPDAVVEAARRKFGDQVQPAITYLANTLSADGTTIPYSTITGIHSTPMLGPLLTADGEPIVPADDEIVLNDWAASDLGVQPGDTVTLTYYRPESTHGQPEEAPPISLRLAAVVPLKRADGTVTMAADPHLTPELEGVTDQETIDQWDLPFELVEEIRPQDEDYWEEYRTTPKAFVSLARGRAMWGSRFGHTTSLRIPVQNGQAAAQVVERLELEPAELGFHFMPVKRDGIEAAAGTTDFNNLFLGFSFFIIAAAVMLVALLFRLGVEQRAAEVGIMAASGMTRRRVGLALGCEAAVVTLIGSCVGIVVGVAYAALMLYGLRTWWLPAIGTPFISLHVTWTSLLVGYAVGTVISLLVIAWSLRQLRRLPVRSLLAGQTQVTLRAAGGGGKRSFQIAIGLLVLAIAAGLAASQLGGMAQAGAFFGSGAAVLIALLLLVWSRMHGGGATRGDVAARFALRGLAIRNAARHPSRSTLTIGLVASASFLIIAMSAFRLTTTEQGTGGFEIVAQSSQPVFHNLDTDEGRFELGVLPENDALLASATTYSLRLHEGDDASCLNLYKPQQPQVLGLPQRFIERGGFAWTDTAATTERQRENPWLLLSETLEDGAVPVVLDANTATYSLHLPRGVGDTLSVPDDRGEPVRLRVVGLLENSILQGSLLVSEANFLEHFPATSGYRYFLVDVDQPESPASTAADAAGDQASAAASESNVTAGSAPSRVQQILAALETSLSDFGLDATRADRRLASFLDVQNTYLLTFQSLGALGLLLGTLGLATVQLRNVLERRSELALLRATGFPHRRLAWLVMLENAVLLLGGLGAGVLAALVAVLPHLLMGGASVPWVALAAMLGIVLVVGLAAGMLVVRAVLHAPLLAALRAE